MSTISINELKQQPAEQWFKATDRDGLVVTSQGDPVAVLLSVDSESLGPTLAALRSVRALQAMAALQKSAEANGTFRLSLNEIDAEIDAARQTRPRQ
ncbi:MAG: type II toxin-antitoxin system Phd/YefM family antitoxin [Verrucomicrobiota bacterium]